MIKCNFKKVISLMTSIMILFCFSSSYLSSNSLTASAICCRKDGFDKSRYTLTGNMAQDVATIAKSQAGRTCSQFGYSGVDYGAWCDEFVADCLENAGCDNSIVIHGGTVADFEAKMKKRGAVVVSSPQPGDLVFFSWSHVEIVTRVENGTVYCAGGNNQGKIYPGGRCAGERNAQSVANSVGGSIRLYLRPNYKNIPNDPPGYANVSLWKNCYMVGEDVTFNMSSDIGTVFTLGIDDENGNRLYTYDTGFENPSTEKTYTMSFDKAGKYSCWITTYNSIGSKDSERFYFTVYDSKPSIATVSLLKNSYMVGEDVTFNMSSDIGIVFTLGIDDEDGNRLYTYDTGFDNPSPQKSYTRAFDKAGKYSCWITTYNGEGNLDSERFYFVIYDKKPEYANVSLYKNSYMVGEDVTFNMSSDTGIVFTLGIDDKDGNRLYTYDTGFDSPSTNKTYTRSFDTPGEYSCWLTTYNAIGNLDSERFYFVILSEIKGDCNNDGQFSVSDILMLQKWLLNDETELTNWQSADLDENGIIDVFDLCLMKQELINK